MIKETLAIKNVRKASIWKHNLFFDDGFNFFKNNELLIHGIYGHEVSNDFVFAYQKSENSITTYLIKSDKIEFFPLALNKTLTNSNTVLVKSNSNSLDPQNTYYLYNLEQRKIIKEIETIGNKHFRIVIGDTFFFDENKKTKLGSFHLPTETTLWQYSVADLDAEKVSKILGVFGQTLVVVCEMPHPTIKNIPIELYLGIDIQSGRLVWQTQEIILPNGETDYMGGNQNRWQWHESATTLYALAGRNYFSLIHKLAKLISQQIFIRN